MKKILVLAVSILAIGSLVAALSKTGSHNTNDKLQVTVSFYPLQDFAKHVGGGYVEITNITPPGAEPHDFEPSAKDLVDAQKADVFMFNSVGFEPWADKFVNDYRGTIVMGIHGISRLKDNDPHVWLDPVLAQKVVNNIRDGLIRANPAHKQDYIQNAKDYNAELAALDRDIRDGLARCRQDTVVTSHNAMSYFAKRYKLNTEAIAGISPEEEPSAARLAEISDIVKEKGITHIFFESLVSPRLADTIAQETGARTLVFDPLEGLSHEDQKNGKDYISVQRENLRNLRIALACS